MSDEFGANYFPQGSGQVKQNEQPVQKDEQNHEKIPFQNENILDSLVDSAGATESSREDMKPSISRAENTFERIENKLDVLLPNTYWILEKKLGLCPLEPDTNELRQLMLVSIGSPNKLSI
ncbi:hypothetical protein ACJMK2_016531 [Sinanodonta woodiana]|uniref:Uncharacterized protein n=1 Tax=Sinanodonta woodiana TaxID=1069815 RepID=A0ABD3UV83_SINWO